jgi:hypothetical protein
MGGSPAASISRSFLRQRLFGSRRADPSHRQEPFAEENFFDAFLAKKGLLGAQPRARPWNASSPWRSATGASMAKASGSESVRSSAV